MASVKTNLKGRAVYVVDGGRTPFLRAMGPPGPFHASDLAVQAGRQLLARQPFEPDALDEVILGCVSSEPNEANIARVVSLRLGCGALVPAWTVQRNCASAMQSLDCAATNIASGRSELVLAGGTEAMSRHPLLLNEQMVTWLASWNKSRDARGRLRQLAKLRPAYFKPVIALLCGLTDPVVGLSMGQTAEELAWAYNISREEMDAYAAQSHQRLAAAQAAGHMGEIEPLYAPDGTLYVTDEGLRPDTSVDKLSRLRPFFDRTVGKVTPGNSSQITDGAALMILASSAAVKRYKLPVLGQILDCQWAGLSPTQMGLGPVHAIAPLLQRHGLATGDIDYWEINEAFAVQVLACLKAWTDKDYCLEQLGLEKPFDPIDMARLNVDGGGISLGHPVGTSGTRIVLHLLKVLEREDAHSGIASLCIGGGQGGAILVGR
ncbi:3-ketoacyl-CoA thiolase @ Acetyl-CoA acetyltransferase [hydrothermal vent metagenome]|uniref:3-ketoacyl-CoA thiolase @ Acetyl-CoA acetyltransferase n=1 Tax=hydrothermal vent metagenome TaxID=652676 RepID=A0A3B1B4Z8_9ZZZZ